MKSKQSSGKSFFNFFINRVHQFYSNRPFVVPAQRIESSVFPSTASSAGIKTTQNIPLSHVTDMCLLFPKDARHVTCYENPCYFDINGALTFDGLDTQNQNTSIELKGHPIFAGEVDTYYNVDTNGKHPPPPILCTVHDTFWLFSPRDGGSCLYDTIHSFDQVINQVTA
ncbi:MAG: hypothetical protein EZS28_047892 [Streblomastix strix]|uniref:Uncharacterized protein n=1 Tax=Streblomastix strix TaxID=222440 RepID=A0A5J4TG30_9EUKA|nr:MAG: hypothetical protein EZS28_047892 [Streblomastix strix]